MPVFGKPIQVGTGATALVPAKPEGTAVQRITNRGAAAIFLGGENVSASGEHVGYELKAGESVEGFLLPAETALYAVAASGEVKAEVLYSHTE